MNERTSMNERNTLLYKNFSLSIYPRKGHTVCCKFEREREMKRHIIREGTSSCPISSSLSQVGANACTCLQAVSSVMTSGWLRILRSTLDSDWTLSKSDRVVLISRGLLSVTHLLDRLTPTHCHPPVYKSQRDSLSEHTGSSGTNPKSMLTVII